MGGVRVIRKANDLVEAKCMLGLVEQKVMNYLISQIKYDDEEFKEYEISAADFCRETGCGEGDIYDQLRKIGKTLTSTNLYLQDGSTFSVVCWASEANYYPGEGRTSFRFTPALKPFLLKLNDNFTIYEWDSIRQLRSVHAMRIYELLKQYGGFKDRQPKEKKGKDGYLYYREFEVDRLKEILGVAGSYRNYHSFKDFVIEIAQKEILEKCEIYFTFKEIKKGRKVNSILFEVFENPNFASARAEKPQAVKEAKAPPERKAKPAAKQSRPEQPPARVIPMPGRPARGETAAKRAALKAEREELERRAEVALSFLEEEGIDLSQRGRIYEKAKGDVDLIRRCYFEYVKKKDDVRDVPSLLIWAVTHENQALKKKIPLKNKPTAKAGPEIKKNRFVNFNQRTNDYDEWERLELEQQVESVKGQ